MALILHLSDLHLRGPESDPPIDDSKRGVVPPVELHKQSGQLRHTLRELSRHLRSENKRLDAVVVSGDVTEKNAKEGFEQFHGILDELRAYPNRHLFQVMMAQPKWSRAR